MVRTTYQNMPLEEWLRKQRPQRFPAKTNYFSRYDGVKDWLKANVYDETTAATLFSEIAQGKEPIYLNKHGLKHIECVLQRARDLVRESCQLTPYEVYFLLVAILIHDAGNIYGRKNHEKMCQKIIYNLGNLLGDDETEKRVVAKIASAHGGREPADPIDGLEEEVQIYSETVRKQLLASILRLADELADDRTRASRFIAEQISIGDSALHHAYSQSLRSVIIADRDIRLSYELTHSIAKRMYTREGQSVYLFDEILSRDMKMFLELLYCNRHARSLLRVERVVAKIEIFDDFGSDKIPERVMDPISFSLQEKGFPIGPEKGIYGLCPDLQWTGEKIKDQIG